MDSLLNFLNGPRLTHTELLYLIILVLLVLANRTDGHRVYLAAVLLAEKLIELSIKPFLPWDLIVSQSTYFGLCFATVILINYRVSVINWLRRITSLRLEVFNNNNSAKEQTAIAFIYGLVGILCLGMIAEHLVRHPDLVGLSSDLAFSIRWLYDIYPTLVSGLTYLMMVILFIMTVDGFAIKQLRKLESKTSS
ncbi:hypothetical protein ACSLBF_14630 [Pseudoalteromonas sp. T1lg65]|uniref:hypothetical protein n=1 Tax=Pseudoalteromonas sp. T1lg65 TaxID=2077101 RepID=UPI003F792B29